MLGCLLAAFTSFGADVRREDCFPIEKLSAPLQSRAAKVFLDTLDSVALYTVIDGLKPMTVDLPELRVAVHRNSKDVTAVADLDRIASTFRCGDDIQMIVCIGCNQDPAARAGNAGDAELYVVNRPEIAAVIERRADLFAPLGVTPLTPPAHVLYLAERFLAPEGRDIKSNVDDAVRHSTIYGLLFGYPEYAVASYGSGFRRALTGEQPPDTRPAPGSPPTGPPIIDISGYNKLPRRFVYRVEPDHVENEEDRRLRTSAAAILSEYAKRRQKYIGNGKPGVINLLRDWFCNASGCSASRA
jgi:hypothetical protein